MVCVSRIWRAQGSGADLHGRRLLESGLDSCVNQNPFTDECVGGIRGHQDCNAGALSVARHH